MAPVIINWSFSCGHRFTKQVVTDNPSHEIKSSTLQCPECTETEDQAQSVAREKEGQKQKKEEATRDQEKNAITLYESQAAFITKQITDDGGENQEFRDHCEKMLENCKVLWASKVRMAGSNAQNQSPQATSSAFLVESWATKIKSACDKASFLKAANDILRAREFALRRRQSTLWSKLDDRCSGWGKVLESIRALDQSLGEDTTLKQLNDLEKAFTKEWERAVEMMKEENKN